MSIVDLIGGLIKDGHKFCILNAFSPYIHEMRQDVVDQVFKIEEQFKYDYMLWIDHDNVFSYADFKRLLSLDKDVISGIYRAVSGVLCSGYMVDGLTVNIKDLKSDEPFEVDYTGFGFTLIKKGVFEKMESPYFVKERAKERFFIDDIAFGIKAKEAGFNIMIDPMTKIGHEKKLVI
jgi:hypothetical protein